MEGAVTLKADRYVWSCPECGKKNFESYINRLQIVTCPNCKESFAVLDWVHKYSEE